MIVAPVGTVITPVKPHSGLDVLQWAKDVQTALQQLRDRKFVVSGETSGNTLIRAHVPLVPKIVGATSGTPNVIVTRGYVVEHATSPDETDGLIYHEITNLLTDGDPTKFAVPDGYAIVVKVPLLADWTVDTSTGCTIEVMDASAAVSTNPNPPNPSYPSGTTGTHYYKLATMAISGDTATLSYFLAGDNVRVEQHSGLNGYITITRENSWQSGTTSYSFEAAGIHIRMIDGKQCAIMDASEGDPPAGWGSQLYALNYATGSDYGSLNTSWF